MGSELYKIDGGQASVNPLKTREDRIKAVDYFRKKRDREANKSRKFIYDRNYMLVKLGINLALRFSDLRRLTVKKVKSGVIQQRDQKTGKENRIEIPSAIFAELKSYISRNGLHESDYLFPSRQGCGNPITRSMGYKIMHQIQDGCHIPYNLGTHTLRKTFGFWFYRKYHDIATLQRILNHSSPSVTLIYIGLQQEEIDKKRRGFVLDD